MHGMNKQRKTNMKIHHKNMKQVFADTQQWVKKNLEPLGIYEFSCNYLDIENQTFMPIGTNYPLYCAYMEKEHHLNVASRLKSGPNLWGNNQELSNLYRNVMDLSPDEKFYKLDWPIKTNVGYELFVLTSATPLKHQELKLIRQKMHTFSYEANKIRKQKSNILLELQSIDEIREQYYNASELRTNRCIEKELSQYFKSSFGNITLTAKEQLYIEHLMFNMTHKEIAYKHKCSEMAVRKIIMNIKRKIGHEGMSTSKMFQRLNELSVLAVCTQAIQHS